VRKILKNGFFVVLGLILAGTSPAWAIEVENESEHQIGVIVFMAQGDRESPMFIKLLEPKEKLLYEAQSGDYVISMHDLETKETLRYEKTGPDDVLVYNGTELALKE